MAYNDVRTVQKGEVREKVGQVIQNGSVLILRDFHLFLAKRDPEITRLVKDAILWGRETGRAIIIMAPVLMLPPELEKEFTVIDFPSRQGGAARTGARPVQGQGCGDERQQGGRDRCGPGPDHG